MISLAPALATASLLLAAAGASASPVTEPNGRISGAIGEIAFDLPAKCDRQPWGKSAIISVNTHEGVMFDLKESPVRDDTALRASFMGRNFAVQAYAGGQRYELGRRRKEAEAHFPFEFSGPYHGDSGEKLEVRLRIDCPF